MWIKAIGVDDNKFKNVLKYGGVGIAGGWKIGGNIVDIGTHEELIDRCDIYKEIYDSQAK
mgnify:CR=1 FL=1